MAWPKDYIYSPTSIWYEPHSPLLHSLLACEDPRGIEIASPLIENQTVHPSLKIKKITSKTHPLIGQRGVFASERIPAGVELGEYSGEISLGYARSNTRKGIYDWKTVIKDMTVSIYSGKYANELTFINDYRGLGQSSNCQPKWIVHRGFYYFIFETTRSIEPSEEVLVDYGATWEKLKQSDRPSFSC